MITKTNVLFTLCMLYILTIPYGCTYFDGKKKDAPKIEDAPKITKKKKESKNQSTDPTKLDKKFISKIEVETLWKKTLGDGYKGHYLKLAPRIVEETLYISDRNGELISADASSGKVLWRILDEGVEYTSAAGFGDGMIFVGTGDGRVIARNSKTGALKWVVRMSSEVLAAPVSEDGITVVRSADGSVVGLDARSGTEIWNYRRSAPKLTIRGNSNPVIEDGVIISGLDSGRLIALDLKVGRLIWNKALSVPTGRTDLERMVDIDGDPLIDDDIIYVGSYQGGVTALSALDGQILWSREISSYNGLTTGEGRIYVVDEDSNIWALNENDGISIWKQDKLAKRYVTSPVYFENHIIVGDFEGYIHWLDAKTGEIVFRKKLDKKGILAPGVVGPDMVIVRSVGGKTIAMRPR